MPDRLWRQIPRCSRATRRRHSACRAFRLRGLFGSQPLAQTPSRSPSSGTPCTATSRRVSSSRAAVVAASVRTGRVIVFTESGSPVPRSTPEFHGRFVATRLDVPAPDGLRGDPGLFPAVHLDEPAEAGVEVELTVDGGGARHLRVQLRVWDRIGRETDEHTSAAIDVRTQRRTAEPPEVTLLAPDPVGVDVTTWGRSPARLRRARPHCPEPGPGSPRDATWRRRRQPLLGSGAPHGPPDGLQADRIPGTASVLDLDRCSTAPPDSHGTARCSPRRSCTASPSRWSGRFRWQGFRATTSRPPRSRALRLHLHGRHVGRSSHGPPHGFGER